MPRPARLLKVVVPVIVLSIFTLLRAQSSAEEPSAKSSIGGLHEKGQIFNCQFGSFLRHCVIL